MDTVVNTHSRAIAETNLHLLPVNRDKSKYPMGYAVHYYSLTRHYTILDITYASLLKL